MPLDIHYAAPRCRCRCAMPLLKQRQLPL